MFIFLGLGDSPDTTFYVDDIKGPQLQGTASVDGYDPTKVQLYPNPAKSTIRFSNLDADKMVTIYDINSKEVLKQKTNNSELSIEQLRPGFYFLEIDGNFQKLIKQ